jgi:hypothetical protein
MSDTLYLSLWYPNLRLAALPDKLAAVLGAFAAHGGEARVYSATVWPVNWSESPVFQQVYGRGDRGAEPAFAVAQALEILHDDYAYEFQIGWSLWELEPGNGGPSASLRSAEDDSAFLEGSRPPTLGAKTETGQEWGTHFPAGTDAQNDNLLGRWVREPHLVRVTGFGPLFDEGAFEQDGHIRLDFGSDAPFLEEDADLESVGARHIEQNVRQLLELTAGVEKGSGATARLLWSELGESLAQRLAARLGVGN